MEDNNESKIDIEEKDKKDTSKLYSEANQLRPIIFSDFKTSNFIF